MAYILALENLDQESFALAGGKAINLGILIKNGIDVPRGFVVTTEAFKNYSPMIRTEINNFSDISTLDLAELESVSQKIRAKIEALDLEDELASEVILALRAFNEKANFAVRSSATVEDLPDLAFAGQQDTFLNINGCDSILTHIKKCWSSLYSAKAIAYRKKNNIGINEAEIAVIVQEMVDAHKSGVMFTANPINNNYNQLIINAGFGLGEAIVSGIINPDYYCINKYSKKKIAQTTAVKELAIFGNHAGGLDKVVLDEKQQRSEALDNKEIEELIHMGLIIEKIYDHPQDIEWAIAGDGKVRVLQSRPITSLYPLPEPSEIVGENQVYISGGHVQVMLDPIKPLGLSIYKEIIQVFMTKLEVENLPLLSEAGGRMYFNLSAIFGVPVIGNMMVKSIKEADYLMGIALKKCISSYKLSPQFPKFKTTKNIYNYFMPMVKAGNKTFKVNPKPDLRAVLDNARAKLISDMREQANNCKDDKDKIELVKQFFYEITFRISDEEGLIGIGGMFNGLKSDRALRKILASFDHVELVDGLERGLEGNITTEMGLAMGDLAETIRGKNDLIKILNDDPANAHRLLLMKQDPEVIASLEKFLVNFGMRAIGEIDITQPRYYEDFSPISAAIITHIENNKAYEHRDNFEEQKKASRRSEEKIIELLKEKHNEKQMAGVYNHIKNIKMYLPLREYPKYYTVSAFAVVKEMLYEIADNMVANGTIAARDDIFFLEISEIETICNQSFADRDWKAPITAKKTLFDRWKNLTPPRVMTNTGEIFTGSYDDVKAPEGALIGTPVSAGVYEGLVRVILDPRREKLRQDEILVTRFTDPGWTPLFVNAKGMVLEIGGMITHGAIVAREYGIPTIVGIENATKRLHTGDFIRINADKGFIEILSTSQDNQIEGN